MGTWSYDILGSDSAVDLESELKERLSADADAAAAFVERRAAIWREGISRSDADTCRRVLEAAAVMMKLGVPLCEQLVELSLAAIEKERRPAALQEFPQSSKRRKALDTFRRKLIAMPGRGPSSAPR